MTRTFACVNQKGGVGKTSTTMHLAGAASRRGLRTLLIDADPQGNLTSALGPDDLTHETAGLADALSFNAPEETLSDVIVPSRWDHVDLVPTTGATLAAVQQELSARSLGGNHVLREALASLETAYDLVLIDCPPSLDTLSINAFTASDALVVITDAARFGGEGLLQLFQTMQMVRQYCDRPDLRIQGAIFNAYDHRQVEQRKWYSEIVSVLEQMGVPEIYPAVPRRITLAACTSSGTRLDQCTDSRASELVKIFDRHLDTLLS